MRKRRYQERTSTFEKVLGVLIAATTVFLVIVLIDATLDGRMKWLLAPVLLVGAIGLFVLAAELLGLTSRRWSQSVLGNVVLAMIILLAIVAVIDPALIADQTGQSRTGRPVAGNPRLWGVIVLVATIPLVVWRLLPRMRQLLGRTPPSGD